MTDSDSSNDTDITDSYGPESLTDLDSEPDSLANSDSNPKSFKFSLYGPVLGAGGLSV